MKLAGKVCLITGSTGIAAATARLSVEEGARVFLAGIDETSCRKLSGEIGAAHHVADLTMPAAAEEAVERCLERFGRLDAVYNVAGISGRRFGDGPLHECTEEGWDVTLAANLKTTFLVSRAALRYFLKAEPAPSGIRGTLLNMTSVLAFSPEPRHFAAHAYAASKGAIVSLTKAMAAYYASHQIRVNAIAPGLVRTPMSKRAQENPEILQYMKTKQPLAGGILDAEDVAKASVFLLSDESRHITGEIVTIDGGWHVSSI